MQNKVLVVDDEEIQANIIRDILVKEGFYVEKVYSAEEALSHMQKHEFDIVLVDLKMPGMGGISFLEEVKRKEAGAKVIIMTAYGTVETAVSAMKKGAFDYITKPFSREELVITVERAADAHKLFLENVHLKETLSDLYTEKKFIGSSEASAEINGLIGRVASNDSAHVLITGESGTGKELVARAVHSASARKDMPFVPVNCSAIPETLLESELFGYERGAFTGAVRKRAGKFKKADGGTIFFDEVADMPLNMQVKLLRVIQDRQITPIGSEETFTVDVRVISATNRDISRMVEEGTFRDDLYYRLNVVPIHIPPLRERPEDISVLIDSIISDLNKKLKKSVKRIPENVLQELLRYDFPGNVRELENMLERAFILAGDDTLNISHFPMLVSHHGAVPENANLSLKDISKQARIEAEKNAIERVLAQTNWNRVKAAGLLHVDYKTLRRKIAELGIHPRYKT
jgi:DNA-binding NtrC family response regulator